MLTEQQIEEMMARVRRLELKARRLVRESFAGEYLSSFRGQGLDFDDFREYQHGDEVRFIDWNVTARMNQPFVRKFREERELSVVLAVDVSGSTIYGSESMSKREIAAEAAAIIGFSALNNGDKVGLLIFAEEPILFIPPEKGTRHLLRMIREILVADPEKASTSIANASDFLVCTLRRKSLVFLISDFIAPELDRPLGKLSRKHETIALRITDPLESKLPRAGKVVLIDPETGHQSLINTNNESLRASYESMTEDQLKNIDQCFKKYAIDSAALDTRHDTLLGLHRMLKKRARKRSR
ncbi:MAG: hypothetical protein RLY69_1314 [Verrucomicrobiota bacterium]|jgi:uncharacterized protein (DUF58 family)